MSLLNKANTDTVITELSYTGISSVGAGDWTHRAYDLMEILLLDQYSNSPNLKLYMKAFIEELDTLLYQTREVYLGRMLEFAEGRQLDIIGEILQQSRSIIISQDAEKWFGFNPYELAVNARGLGNLEGIYTPSHVGNPNDALYTPGYFKPVNWQPWKFVPLLDIEYRAVLLARGFVCNNKTKDINTTYKVIHLLLGRIPKHIKLIEVDNREIVLELETAYTTEKEVALITTLKTWFIPMGVNFSIVLI